MQQRLRLFTKADKQQLEAFEIWIWRIMLMISWKNMVTNASVLKKSEVRKMLNTIWQ